MRITMGPSTKENASNQHSVAIEGPCDDLSLDEVCVLLQAALIAYGYSSHGVEEVFNAESNGANPGEGSLEEGSQGET